MATYEVNMSSLHLLVAAESNCGDDKIRIRHMLVRFLVHMTNPINTVLYTRQD